MNYKQGREQLIWNVRLDFDPVGIKFLSDESTISNFPVTHRVKSRLAYCQFLAAVRQERYALFMEPKKCLCENARLVFGFRELDREADTKRHLKYMMDEETSFQASKQKAKLASGSCKGIYMAPLDFFDKAGSEPDLVYIVCVPYQAYHLLNDYMGSRKIPGLSFFHTPNSSVCGGGIFAYNNMTANMTTMCAGSKTSGKTEMNYLNLFIPGKHILPMLEQQTMRAGDGGISLLGKGSRPWPGLDVCKACPMFKFEKIEEYPG